MNQNKAPLDIKYFMGQNYIMYFYFSFTYHTPNL